MSTPPKGPGPSPCSREGSPSPSVGGDAYEAGRGAHPAVDLSRDRFEAFVASRLDEAPSPEVAADLYLACACAHGDPAALAAFEAAFVVRVPSFVAKIDTSPAFIDEVKQQLRERLLVQKKEQSPKIAEYRGRGRLVSWLRVAAIRTALNLKTGKAKDRTEDEEAADALLVDDDPELEYLRARYRQQFHDAFVGALASLEPRGRTVLRMHLIDGLNIDGIGSVYGVHRATIARWIASARDHLFETTRDALHEELGLSATEFASLVRLVRSQLDVSICRILREQENAG